MIDSIHKATNKIFKDIFKSNMCQLLHSYFVPVSVCCSRQTCADCCIPILSRSQCVIHLKHVPIAAFLFCPGLRVLFSANMCQLLHSYLSRSQCAVLLKHVPIAAFLFVPVSVCYSQQTCANCCIPICPGLSVLFSANMCQLLHSNLSRSQCAVLLKHVPIAAFLFVPVSVCYSQQTCVNCCIPICPGLSVLFSANMCQLLHSYLSRSQGVILSKHVPIAAPLFVSVSVCCSPQTCANCCIPILSRSQCVIVLKHVPIAAFLFCPSLSVLFSANMCQ